MSQSIFFLAFLSISQVNAWQGWTETQWPPVYTSASKPTSSVSGSVVVPTPSDTAPLNHDLAYYKLNGTNGEKQQLTHSFIKVDCGATLSVHHTDPGVFPDGGTAGRPILLLQHGYPESSYIWRKLTASLSKRVPLIVADRPGYGLSQRCPSSADERTNANALLDLVVKIYGKDQHVILAGHDRGARAMQRAAVDFGQGLHPEMTALGVWLADIVPIVDEYASFTKPSNAVGYFHWSLLPRLQEGFSLALLMAYGGGAFSDFLCQAGQGTNETAIQSFKDDNAFAVYHTFYDQVYVTNASIWDYYYGATSDFTEMVADQEANRKIKMPTHVEYSQYNLEVLSGFDVPAIWSNYVDDPSLLTTGPVCCGQGHFIIELAPEETLQQLNTFMDVLGVKPGN